MPQEFPGVNPYIEAQGYWPGFHLKFLNYLQEAVSDQLPADYDAQLDERIQLTDTESARQQLVKPDVVILQSRRSSPDSTRTQLLEPETIPTLIVDEEFQAFLKIVYRPDRRVVTILELLSPANKTGESRREYVERRNSILRSESHLVELDLLVSGRRVPMERPLPKGDFHAIVSRREDRPDCAVYTWTIGMPLPLLPIPLRSPDADIVIDLAAVYRTAFDRGRYARTIDANAPIDLPFSN